MRALLLLLPLSLAACDGTIGVKDDKSDNKVAIEGKADGEVKFDLPFAKGELKLPASIMSEADFDIDGVKMVPGGKITGFNVDAGEDRPAKVNLSFSAPTPPEAVRSYFVDEFNKRDVNTALAGDALRGATDDGDQFVMRFAPQGTGTAGTIEITSAK